MVVTGAGDGEGVGVGWCLLPMTDEIVELLCEGFSMFGTAA